MPVNRLPERKETDVTFIVMPRGEERYVFVFDDAHRAQILRTLGRWAADPELSLTWYSAAILSQQIRGTYVQSKGDPS
jgi:hypothetical protein